MTRRLAALDRTLTLLAGLALVVVGAGAIAWWLGHLAVVGPVLDAGWLPTLVRTGWWPWASTAVAVVLAVLGLRWLVAHLPHRAPARVALAGSEVTGRLDADLGTVAQQAADSLAATPGIASGSSRVVSDRGAIVVELTATVPPETGLSTAATAIDRAGAELARVLGPSCPAVRGWVRVARG